ncbi:MAG: DUF2306 domain-containing protein [Bacteroidota bacterium]
MSFQKIGKTSFSLLILYGIYLLVLLSLPYLSFKRGVDFLATKELIYHLDWWRYSFYVHVFSSPIVIITGFLQFFKIFIKRYPTFHRWIGRLYIFTLLFFAAPSGLLIGLYANGGYFTQVMFVLLASCWMISGFLAYHFARKKEFKIHGDWMLRNYALTISAITLRFYAYLFDVFSVPLGQIESYQVLSFLSWVPNLVVAELIIRTGFSKKIMESN